MTWDAMIRRVDLARFRRDASRRDLLTFLVPPDDAALATAPLLQRTARNWIGLLDQRIRHCIICSAWIVNRMSVCCCWPCQRWSSRHRRVAVECAASARMPVCHRRHWRRLVRLCCMRSSPVAASSTRAHHHEAGSTIDI